MILLELYDYFEPENGRNISIDVKKTVSGVQVTSDVLLTECNIEQISDYTYHVIVYDNDDTCEIVYACTFKQFVESKQAIELLYDLFIETAIQREC